MFKHYFEHIGEVEMTSRNHKHVLIINHVPIVQIVHGDVTGVNRKMVIHVMLKDRYMVVR